MPKIPQKKFGCYANVVYICLSVNEKLTYSIAKKRIINE